MLLSPLASSCLKVLESIMVNGAVVDFPFSFVITWLCFFIFVKHAYNCDRTMQEDLPSRKEKKKSTQKPDVYLDTLKKMPPF